MTESLKALLGTLSTMKNLNIEMYMHWCHNWRTAVLRRAIPHWGESPLSQAQVRAAGARGPWGHRVLVITTEIGTANCSYYLPFGRGRAVMRDRSADNITTRDIHHPWSPSWLGYGLRMKVHVPVTYLKGCWEDWRIVTWHDDGWEEESGDCGGCLWFLRVLINQRLTGDYIWRFLS